MINELDTEMVLKEMDELEAKGGRFMEIIEDYKKYTRMEYKKIQLPTGYYGFKSERIYGSAAYVCRRK